MEEKTRFFGTVSGMLKGLIHPAEYIETGKKGNMVFRSLVNNNCKHCFTIGHFLYTSQQTSRI